MSKTVKEVASVFALVVGAWLVYWFVDTFGYIFGAIASLFTLGLVIKAIEAIRAGVAASGAGTGEFYADEDELKGLPMPSLFSGDYAFQLAAVGESSYKSTMNALLPPETRGAERFRVYTKVNLRPESTNKYDANAVVVLLCGKTVAYLAREDAKRYRSAHGETAHTAWAVIIGGEGKTAGVWLDISGEQLS